MKAEFIAPTAKSPLDSARGRGKVRTPRRCTPKNIKSECDGPFSVILVVKNDSTQIVECKNGK
jgi:hypothetical protein